MISCCLCDFQAFSKGNLSFHLNNVHFKDKEFMCRLCHFKTAYKGALTRHVNSVHLRTGKTKECPICGYITASLLNLNSHLSVSHHLEIATAFARPSNLNGGGLSSGPPGPPTHTNGTPPDPQEVEPASRQSSRSSPHRPRLHECRICPFQGQDNTELIMHYNLVHLNPAHTVLSRDSVVNVAAAAAAARHHLPTSSAGYLPSSNAGGEEEPRDFSVIRDSELLLRRRGEELFRRQELLSRIEQSRIVRQEELVAHLNTSARLLHQHHHQQQQQQQHHHQQQQEQEQIEIQHKLVAQRSPSQERSPVASPPPADVEPVPRQGDDHVAYDENVSNALKCRLCPFQASSYFYLKNHIRTSHLGEVHTVACPLCEYTSDAKGDIEAHLQEDHPQKYADKRSVITID